MADRCQQPTTNDQQPTTKNQLEGDVSKLEVKKQKANKSLNSTKKKLSGIEAKERALGERIDLVKLGLQAGYSLEDQRALFSYLIDRNIGKSPNHSIAHLLQRLEAVKTL